MSAAKDFEVRVVVPARSEFLHLVRLNVAGVLGDAEFTIDEIDDVKIAVEELTAALLAGGSGPDIDIKISVSGARAEVSGARDAGGDSITLDDFVQTILGAVVDSYQVEVADGRARFTFTKVRS